MLTVYWLCFCIGGVFVLLASVAGLDGADFDTSWDVDLELSDRADSTSRSQLSVHRRSLKPPFFSLRFWTVGSCFFGLTGILLSRLRSPLSPGLVMGVAIAVGILMGTAIVWAIDALRQREADSLVRTGDLAGLSGTVEIPFDPNRRGKIRVLVKGATIDFVAQTQESKEFQRGDRVVIVGVEGSNVWVVSQSSFGAAT